MRSGAHERSDYRTHAHTEIHLHINMYTRILNAEWCSLLEMYSILRGATF